MKPFIFSIDEPFCINYKKCKTCSKMKTNLDEGLVFRADDSPSQVDRINKLCQYTCTPDLHTVLIWIKQNPNQSSPHNLFTT